jgi:hypothetical protein
MTSPRSAAAAVRLTIGRPPKVGTEHALQPAVGRPARCRARVLDVWEHADGGTVVFLELAAREIPVRYLRRGGGFTTEVGHAARDPQSGAAEWAPEEDWQDPGTEVREDYRRTLESESIDRLLTEVADWEGYVKLKQLARARGVDIRSDLRAIERRIEALVRKVAA